MSRGGLGRGGALEKAWLDDYAVGERFNVFLPKSFVAFYGMEQVRFTAPGRLGDTIHLEAEGIGVEPKDAKRGVLTRRAPS